MLAILATAPAWVTLSQAKFGTQLDDIKAQTAGDVPQNTPLIQLLGFVWNMPSVASSSEGLGGGITWAWDPMLCDRLLPRFHEDVLWIKFITCDSLRAAMHRGFASWGANHAHISFVDVTEECHALGRLDPSCPLLELWVTALNKTDGNTQLTAPLVTADGPVDEAALDSLGAVAERQASSTRTAAMATPSAQYSTDFRWTNGLVYAGAAHRPMIETHKAVISFNVEDTFCWYLDSTL